jgi:hypothetical protein
VKAFVPRLAGALVAIGAAVLAIAAAPTEDPNDRGAYAFVPAADAAACAIACAQDSICLAWSYKASEFVGCSLKAVVPLPVEDSEIVSGIADRAAAFLALTQPAAPQAAPARPKPAARPVPARIAPSTPAPRPYQQTAAAAPSPRDEELLGAP